MGAWVPRYLHLPVQILWFDIEDLVLIIICYCLWLMVGTWWSLPIVVLVPWWFMAIKADKPRGYVQHLLYTYGFVKMEVYPPPMETEFIE